MFKKGDRARHPGRPEWELGKVLEDSAGGKVKVHFAGAGEKQISLSHVNLEKVEGAEARHPLLDNLKAKNAGGRARTATLRDLVYKFRQMYPGDAPFSTEAYLSDERRYKLEAHGEMTHQLNRAEFSRLLAGSSYDEVCARARRVVNKTNLLSRYESMDLHDGLKVPERQKLFAESLFGLLYGEGEKEERFNSFADALAVIGAAKWTTATYFAFITYPGEEMYMKPVATQEAAEACAFELNYRPEPNRLTYRCLLDFGRHLRNELTREGLSPRDMIDAQSFIWCVRSEK
jgi:hypothetical protein